MSRYFVTVRRDNKKGTQFSNEVWDQYPPSIDKTDFNKAMHEYDSIIVLWYALIDEDKMTEGSIYGS